MCKTHHGKLICSLSLAMLAPLLRVEEAIRSLLFCSASAARRTHLFGVTRTTTSIVREPL